jgi:hypothetical protein
MGLLIHFMATSEFGLARVLVVGKQYQIVGLNSTGLDQAGLKRKPSSPEFFEFTSTSLKFWPSCDIL